jgi:hypothetical protein
VADGNGTNGVDLTGPLARLWRDVYRKAGAVAEARAQALLNYHVYVYGHPPRREDTGPWVDEAGDTMTGTLHFRGQDVDEGGAIEVTSPADLPLDLHLYGAGTPEYTPAQSGVAGREYGIRFVAEQALYLVAVYWYRVDPDQAQPVGFSLWDTTAPASPVWSVSPDMAGADVGWREHRLAQDTQPLLVAGRAYTLSYLSDLPPEPDPHYSTTEWNVFPVPDAHITFDANVHGPPATPGYPDIEASSIAWGLDGAFRTTLDFPDPARSGALRLPNGDPGAIAWRNANNDGDHRLTVNRFDQLVFDGSVIGGSGAGGGNALMYTQATAPAGAPNSLWFNPGESA